MTASIAAALMPGRILARNPRGGAIPPVTIQSALFGANIPVGGGPYLSTENLPIFKNQVRQGVFLTSSFHLSPTDSSGWPIGNVYINLSAIETSLAQMEWASPGVFTCGFVGSGSETIAGTNGTIGSLVQRASPLYTTFTFTPSALNFGYNIGSVTIDTTNHFAYSPGFTGSAIDDPTQISAYRPDAITHYSNYGWLRFMQWSDAHNNTQLGTSANRNTASNTQAQPFPSADAITCAIFSPAPTPAQGTTLTLNTPWVPPSQKQILGIWNQTLGHLDVRLATFTNGSQSVTLDAALTTGDNYVAYPLTWSPAPSFSQGTTLTLSANAPRTYTTLIAFQNTTTSGYDYRTCTFSSTSTSVTISSPLTNGDTYGTSSGFTIGNVAFDGYPIEWAVAFANACNTGLWVNTPFYEDSASLIGAPGTYCTAVMNYINSNYTGPGPVYFEQANEIWNTFYTGLTYLAAQAALTLTTYLAQRAHIFANIGRSVFGSNWGIKFKQVLAWQQGALSWFCPIMSYLQTTYGSAVADVQVLAVAPYITPAILTGDSLATVQSKTSALASAVPNQANLNFAENIAITAMYYGAKLIAYESGVAWNAVSNQNANVGLAIMDAGMQPIINTYYTGLFNSGFAGCSHFTEGVQGVPDNRGPVDEMALDWTTFLASGSPTYNAVSSFFSGLTPTRNVVAVGSASVVDCINYADNTSTTPTRSGNAGLGVYPYLGQITASFQGPFENITGELGYLINCTVAGTSTMTVYFTTTASGTCHVNVNGTTLNGGSAFSISNGLTNQVGLTVSVTFVKGQNYVLLGQSGAQTGIVPRSLHFT